MTTAPWPQPWPSIDESLSNGLAALTQASISQASEGTLADVARRLDAALRIRNAADLIANECEQRLVDDMDTDGLTVAGVGLVTRQEVKRSSWRDDAASSRFREDVARAIVDDIALDPATGELDAVKRNIARATMSLAMDVLPSFQGLRSGMARHIGIDLGDYRQFSTGHKIVVQGLAERK
jgi:hypothetical protein